jgi:hypothetical protein
MFTSVKSMPQKDITSDGESSFAIARNQYVNTHTSEPPKKKWYGSTTSRDASSIINRRKVNQIGVGSLNASEEQQSFTTVTTINTVKDALTRVRAGGSVVPAKCQQRR